MTAIISLSPIIISVIVLIYALRRSFNKRALIVSAAITMVVEMMMMMMKNNDTWYVFLFSLTVPLAVSYVAICLVLSVLERIEK